MRNRNYSLLKLLVLEEMLGDSTTADMSRRLGFSFDKYKRWLENKKILKWDEFEFLCRSLNLNLPAALNFIHYFKAEEQNILIHLKTFNSFNSLQETADYLSCHLSVIKRYNAGLTVPDVDVVFKLIDYSANTLAPFIKLIFNGKIKNELLNNYLLEDMKSAKYFSSKKLLPAMIQSALHFEPSIKEKPTDQWLSKIFRVPLDEIQSELKDMEKAELVKFDGVDTYTAVFESVSFSGLSLKENIPFFQDLNHKMVELLEEKRLQDNPVIKPGGIACRIYPASEDTTEKIRTLLGQTNSQIMKILEEESQPLTQSFAFIFQVMPLSHRN